ncbi:EF hand domain-containing protein [Besnoitia besnoiti]|uniref:EF hand domain-containing protein n=1 Tax=Besnoitia besnoiti TaxID=94643 RepID=A0A2A9M510_BESBE|nr:EF hand domain-containing protein [Besnoitia besnoiti]PFH33029.1 EF hand domain-containing protein [Besnoitia besnoiti]
MRKLVLRLLLLLASASPISSAAQEEGEHEGADHSYVVNNLTIAIVAVILILTLIFELTHESIVEALEHKHLHHALDIVNAVNKEMTILGFIALLLFAMTRSGFVMRVSDKLLGQTELEKVGIGEIKKEGGNPYAAPTPLFELFEQVHITVFLLMVAFCGAIGLLLVAAVVEISRWRRYESIEFIELQRRVEEGRISEDHLKFWFLQYKFVNPSNPLLAHPKSGFSFGEYLSERLTALIAQLVEVSPSTWITIMALALLVRPVLGFGPRGTVKFFFALAGVLAFSTVLLYIFVSRLLSHLWPGSAAVAKHIENVTKPGYVGSPGEAPIDQAEPVVKNNAVCALVQGTKAVNCQEALFCLGSKGHRVTRIVIQLLIFAHVVTIACLAKMMLSGHSQHVIFEPMGYWTGYVPLLIAAASLFAFPAITAKFSTFTSVGYFADNEALRRSSEKLQRRKLARYYQILHFLQHKANVFFARQQNNIDDEIRRAKEVYDSLPVVTQKGYQDIFHAFSSNGEQPRVPVSNLFLMMKAFELDQRVPDCRRKIDEWIAILDTKKKGELTYPQFVTLMLFLLQDEAPEMKNRAVEERRLKDLFNAIDTDGDGFVTMEELLGQLHGLKPAVSRGEATELMAEIAGGRYGEIVRPHQLFTWVRAMEDRAQTLMPQADAPHH